VKEKADTFVEIVDLATNKVVKRIGPMTESKADVAMRGVDRNLDHDRFISRFSTEES